MPAESRTPLWSARFVLFGLPVFLAAAGVVAHRWHIYAALPWVALSWLLALPWVVRVARRQSGRAGQRKGSRHEKAA